MRDAAQHATRTCDVAVVGTGVIGLATAFELLQRGLAVTVVGHRAGARTGQATRAAGAMLSTFSEVEPQQSPERVAVEVAERLAAHEMYPGWLDRITAAAGTQAPVEAIGGTWVVAGPGEDQALTVIAEAARAAGHTAELHPAGAVPGLRPASLTRALWLPTEARVDTTPLMSALTAAITAHPNAGWITGPATAVRPGTVTTSGGTVTCDRVVLAAGTGIPALLPDAGRDLGLPPILAGRGVSALLRTSQPMVRDVVRTPNAAFACGTHLVPRADGALYLGGTNRLTTSPDPERHASVDELTTLLHDATTVLDHRLAGAELLDTRVGLRPYTLDHLPLIGPTRDDGLLLATATYRCGVLLAPRLAALVADEICRPGALDEHPYRARRPVGRQSPGDVLDAGAATGLVDHLLQGGGHLPLAARAALVAFCDLALRHLLDGDHAGVGRAGVTRLWDAAPVAEVIPSVYALAGRLAGGTR